MGKEAMRKRIWTKSKWKKIELQNKTVEFKIPAPVKGWLLHGNGKFLIAQNRAGLLFVQIVVVSSGRDWAERFATHYEIPQRGVDRIRRHPDQTVAEFLLV
jgi:hypothetical protein